MSLSNSLNPIVLNLKIGDQLTTISCGHIVVELIKLIVYQRLQIPYPYQWFKQVITKKQACQTKNDTFQSENHFRVASTALNNLDFIIKTLLKEIDGPLAPEEICIVLGGTPLTCKEMYRILLPAMCHKPHCQSTCIASDQKIQRSVFKTLLTSDQLSQVFFNSLPPTNIYVFIKKKNMCNQDVVCSDSFVFTSGYKVPRSSKVIILNFRTGNEENLSCCDKFQVFEDVLNDNIFSSKINKHDDSECTSEHFSELESTNTSKWYQSNYVVKGFKDCIVDGTSVTNKWLCCVSE